MPGKFLRFLSSQVFAMAVVIPAAAQSEVPAGLFRKGPSFQQRVEQRLDDHEERLNRLEMVSTPRRSASTGGGKNPVRSSAKQPVAARTAAARPSPGKASTKPGGKSGSKSSVAKSSATGSHTVQAGDTPSSIARRYGVSVSKLLQANGLSDGSVIRPGQKLVLPGAGVAKAPATAPALAAEKAAAPAPKVPGGTGRHTVQKGETVRGLAQRFGMTEKEFMRLNGLKDPTRLRAGAVVKFPVAAMAAETADAFAPGDGTPAPDPLPPGWRWHTVERGESLSQIAPRYGQDRGTLERANDLQPGTPIHEGMRLKVPPAGESLDPPEPEAVAPRGDESQTVLGYTVQKGDTLEKLADTFATTPAILRQLNRLAPGDTLASGSRIVVPNNLFE